MKFDNLRAFGHNIGASLASGMCFMVGLRTVDIFAEAAASESGIIHLDVLSGLPEGSDVSQKLRETIMAYRDALPELAGQNRVELGKIRQIRISFFDRGMHGWRFVVTVEDDQGHLAQDEYFGLDGSKPLKRRA